MKTVMRVVVFFALCGLSFGLSGCTESGSAVSSRSVEFHKKLEDGRTVTCISDQGTSCDWENAR